MKRYVVCFVFTSDLGRAYLLLRKKPPYAGLLNGFGGKVEGQETVQAAMYRELREETGLQARDLRKMQLMMTIRYPSDVELTVFYAVLRPGRTPIAAAAQAEGEIEMQPLGRALLAANHPRFAGEGNVAYFLNLALVLEGVDTAAYDA